MQTVRSLWQIIDFQTLVVTAFAVASTYLCGRFGFTADFPLTLLGIAIVFPIVFSIGGAYKRREAALDDYATIKAHGRALYFATRDWIPENDEAAQREILELLGNFLRACRELFQTPLEAMGPKEEAVYTEFSNMSRFIKSLRARDLPSGEASRCNQFLSKMMVGFEQLKHTYQYRTPRTLRAYSQFFIVLLPVLYGPYFASLGTELTPALRYVMPVLFSVVLVSLDNIQDHLENPFDQVGEDDIRINAEKFVERLQSMT